MGPPERLTDDCDHVGILLKMFLNEMFVLIFNIHFFLFIFFLLLLHL